RVRPGARARLCGLERGAGARLRGRGRARPGGGRARGRGAQRGRPEGPLDGRADGRDCAPAARRRGAGLAAARGHARGPPVGGRGAGHGGGGRTMIDKMADKPMSGKNVVVLGAGMIGSAVAMDLAREGRLRVTVADKSAAALARAAARYGVETREADLASPAAV